MYGNKGFIGCDFNGGFFEKLFDTDSYTQR